MALKLDSKLQNYVHFFNFMLNVCHFLRKSSQLRASFINNQISSHIRYAPYLIHRLNVSRDYDGGYANFTRPIVILDLSEKQSNYERLLYSVPKLLSIRQANTINEFLLKQKIDIAHFHYGTDCGVFYPYTRKLKVPSVVSFYGYDVSSFPKLLFGYGRKYLQNRVFSRVDKVLAMSPDMKSDLIASGCPEEKIIVHYYGTDCARFYHEHAYPEKENVTIITLSNLCPKKGHIFQFKALRSLLDKGIKNFRFRVMGSGELEEELKSFVLKNGLKDYVHFAGPVKYGSAEMMKEFREADIFLHPSVIAPNGDKEGIPGTVIEAMASGLPVVSTYHAGIPHVISNDATGLLVEEWDVEALGNAIIELIENKYLRERLGKAAQEYAMNNLTLQEKEQELEVIYDDIIRSFTQQ